MNCIIVEDQPPAQRILKKYIEEYGTLQCKAVFSDGIEAIKFLKQENVDLIFLDIHLPKMSGVDFLKSLSDPPQVIFTTAFPDYALQGYDLNVVDYLLKPFSFQRFVQAISKVKENHNKEGASDLEKNGRMKEIFIKSGHDYLKVVLDEVVYIKSDSDYTELYTQEKKYLSSEPLRYWMEELKFNPFTRVHKSYIIHTDKIEKLSGNQIYLKGGAIIPLGRTYKDDFVHTYIKQSS